MDASNRVTSSFKIKKRPGKVVFKILFPFYQLKYYYYLWNVCK